jgi:ATP-binding cassette subfamily B protein
MIFLRQFILFVQDKIKKLLKSLSNLLYLPKLFLLIWNTNPYYSFLVIFFRLLRAFLPIALLFISKLIVDKLIDIKLGNSLIEELWPLVALEIFIVSLNEISTRVSTLLESLLGDLLSNETILKLMGQTIKLDLPHFENPEFYDKLTRAKKHLFVRVVIFTNLLSLIQDTLILVSIAISALSYNIWLFLLLSLSIIPSLLNATHFASLEYSMIFRWTKEQRLLEYLMDLTTSDKTAKEIQSLSLGDWLIERFKKLSKKFYEENKNLAIRKNLTAILFTIIGIVGYYLAFVFILKQTVTGTISLGSMTFLSLCFLRSREHLHKVIISTSEIYSQSLYLKDLFDFLEIKPSIISSKNALKVSQNLKEGIIFENVSFRYPGSENLVINRLNFQIKIGEHIAFVGENGAGKTTIAKLILRLYDPTEGRILLDGRDLREYELSSLRKSLAVLFQDFLHYDMSFDENISVGDINLASPYIDHPEVLLKDKTTENPFLKRLDFAINESLAKSLLDRLPNGHKQILGHRFDEGMELSGGEWQKIAIARIHMKEAQIFILDEPTAALDVRAEYEIFKRFTRSLTNRIAIIISHRFSTIKMADRIIVLQKGCIVEEGSHTKLLQNQGLYAELFKIQSLENK